MLEETIGRSALGLMSIEANLPLQKPDVFVSDEELNEEGKLIKLIKKCNARGGTDNITVAYLVKEGGIEWYKRGKK